MKMRLATITKEVKKHDRELYCDELPSGIPAIFRRTVRQEVYDLDDRGKEKLVVFKDSPHLVFALTDDWSVRTEIADWGLEPIMSRLKAMDLWNNKSFMDDLIKSYEKTDEAKAKDRRNNTESFLYEFRDHVKKDWKDINTASMAKKDKRYLTDKRIKGD